MRVLVAMAQVACEQGLGSTTVAHVVSRAGVSRRTFYDLFEDRQACFLATFEEAVGQAAERVAVAYAAEREWVDRLRAGLLELLMFMEEEPELAQLCVVEALAAGPVVLARRGEILASLARVVDEGRAEVRGKSPAPLTAEGVVGAVFSLIHSRFTVPTNGSELERPLVDLLGPLMAIVVLPYLGSGAAARELSCCAPARPGVSRDPRPSRNPLDDLQMRVTYRTLRVLGVIAQRPGASNREIAKRAGISDQGQISKLLTRLEGLGLTENTGAGQMKGATNSWQLTRRGMEIQRTMVPQSSVVVRVPPNT